MASTTAPGYRISGLLAFPKEHGITVAFTVSCLTALLLSAQQLLVPMKLLLLFLQFLSLQKQKVLAFSTLFSLVVLCSLSGSIDSAIATCLPALFFYAGTKTLELLPKSKRTLLEIMAIVGACATPILCCDGLTLVNKVYCIAALASTEIFGVLAIKLSIQRNYKHESPQTNSLLFALGILLWLICFSCCRDSGFYANFIIIQLLTVGQIHFLSKLDSFREMGKTAAVFAIFTAILLTASVGN